jgi:SAM-dependent methyltransferase
VTWRRAARRTLPPTAVRWARQRSARLRADPAVGDVDFGDLRRVEPIDRAFGLLRGGTTIDRYFIDPFLRAHAADIRGRVLEIAEDRYSSEIGGRAVERVDVLALEPTPTAAIVADLCNPPDNLPWRAFDCAVITQTLQLVREPVAALATLERLLKPRGVLLLTAPGITQLSRFDADRWGDRWRFTSLSLRECAERYFGEVATVGFGNVLAAVAHLEGLVAEDLPPALLDRADPDYEVIVCLRAVRA